MQAAGLAEDGLIDEMKQSTGYAGHEDVWGEHGYGHLNPFHGRGAGHTWLPGRYNDRSGHHHADWAW
jgi:hypothetical protein